MHKLAGTKGFGRTIRIHNTPLPPRPYTQSFTSFTLAHSLHTDTHTKPTKTTATWTHYSIQHVSTK